MHAHTRTIYVISTAKACQERTANHHGQSVMGFRQRWASDSDGSSPDPSCLLLFCGLVNGWMDGWMATSLGTSSTPPHTGPIFYNWPWPWHSSFNCRRNTATETIIIKPVFTVFPSEAVCPRVVDRPAPQSPTRHDFPPTRAVEILGFRDLQISKPSNPCRDKQSIQRIPTSILSGSRPPLCAAPMSRYLSKSSCIPRPSSSPISHL